MDIRLFGTVAVRHDGAVVPLGPRRTRFVLAVLALEVNQPVAASRLIDLAWPDGSPRSATNAIQVCVSHLRGSLTAAGIPAAVARIDRTGDAYLLRADASTIDVHRFRDDLSGAARTTDDRARIDTLTRALDLWEGPPLADVAPADVRERLCRDLDEERLGAIEDRFEAQLRLGLHRQILGEIGAVSEAYPWRERLVTVHMTALYREHRAAESLALFRDFRRRLAENLGVDPGPALRALEVAILRSDPALTPSPARPRPARDRVIPRGLPPDVYGFLGRRSELDELDRLLDAAAHAPAVSVAAISGTGGVGKTALAVHWAHRVADRFPDGQLYLDLHGFDRSAPMPPERALIAMLSTLGVPTDTERVDLGACYRTALHGRRLLIVLDNASSAAQVRRLLPGTPSCFVLVTSRNRLGGLVARDGARRLSLDALPMADALALLRTLAGEIDDEVAVTLAEQCVRLPLALRIAADLLASTAYPDGADLTAALGDEHRRLDLLDAGADQETAVRAVFSWSERHLTPSAAHLFRLLGLLPWDGLGEAAIVALAGGDRTAVTGDIAALVGAHLLEEAGADRWRMHDLLRVYAAERCAAELDDAATHAAITGLLDHYLATATTVCAAQDGSDWLDRERHNLVVLTVHAAHHGWPAHATRLATTLSGYLTRGLHTSEGVAVHRAALSVALAGTEPIARIDTWHRLGATHLQEGDLPAATDCYRRALAMARTLGDRARQAISLNHLGSILTTRGDYGAARGSFQDALALFRAAGELQGQGQVLARIGRIDWWQGDSAEAARKLREAYTIAVRIDDGVGQCRTLNQLGLALERSNHVVAAEYYQRANDIATRIGDRASEACTRKDMGRLACQAGKHELGFAHLRAAMAAFTDIGNRVGEVEVNIDLGYAFTGIARYRDALMHHRRAYTLACSIGTPRLQAESLSGFAAALLDADRPVAAYECWRRALDIYRKLRMHSAAASVETRMTGLDPGRPLRALTA